MSESLEIERKYLLSGVPDFPSGTPSDVLRQGYIRPAMVDESSPFREGRLRERILSDGSRQWFHTIKTGIGRVRTEVEREIDAEAFAIGWPDTEGARLCKRRYRVADGTQTWEIDVFEDRDLVLAEIELPEPDAPVVIPPWLSPVLVREVTEDPAFVNLNLAC